tara:strand:- start:2225 stop:2545 length:321 start_codon:yes stop_codon:yes gene_type:complete
MENYKTYAVTISSNDFNSNYEVLAESVPHAVEQVLDIVQTFENIENQTEYTPYSQSKTEIQDNNSSNLYEAYTSYVKDKIVKIKDNFPICFTKDEPEDNSYSPYKK